MNCRLTAAGNVRPKGKCYSRAGSLFFMSMLLLLLLLIAQATARPADEGDETLSDADNIEYHHVKIVDGVMHEDHPIVMYKEDFVSEDFDPSKSKGHKNYKTIVRQQQRPNHTEQYNVLKPEKLYFDVLPQAPIVVEDDVAADSKFDASQIRAELVPLVADDADDNIANNAIAVAESKSALSKRPKKYHSRERRSTDEHDEHKVHKRNPYYRTQVGYIYPPPQPVAQYQTPLYSVSWHQSQSPRGFVRHPVQGKRPNLLQPGRLPESVGSRGDFDDRIWGSRPNTNRPTLAPAPVATPPASIWHDSNPENFDFSVYETTPRPLTEPSNTIDRRPPANRPVSAVTESPAGRASRPVSNCVWAIVNCCSSDDNSVRYNCFEEFNCSGAFWGLNPCADNVRDNAIQYVDSLYSV